MIDQKEVISVDGIYTPMMQNDLFVLVFFILRDGRYLKMRYPYARRDSAEKMDAYLRGKADTPVVPDYRPEVYFIEQGRKR